MAVSTAYSVLDFSGNGSTTAFAVSWPFFDGTLVVSQIVNATGVETVKVLDSDYTVTGGTDADGLPATGTVTMSVAPASGITLRIQRSTPLVQSTSWAAFDAFPQKTAEGSYDYGLLIAQELAAATALGLVDTPFATYWDATGEIIRNVGEPEEDDDAATKGYVDDQVALFDDASIAIGTVTTGAAGSSAAASLSGTYPTYTLNLTIPRGATGASGAGTGDVLGPATSADTTVPRFNGTDSKTIEATGLIVSDADDLNVPRGLRVGFSGTAAAADRVEVGDANFSVDFNTVNLPLINFDTNDYLGFSRTGNYMTLVIGGSEYFRWDTTNALAVPFPQGRITTSTGVPVDTRNSSTGVTTIYYTPYVGRYVPIYNGTRFVMSDIGGELSCDLTDNTKSPAAAAADTLYDLFVWNDSGTYRLSRGPAWTTSTDGSGDRGTGAGTTQLTQFTNGMYANAVAITNGPGQYLGTYVGTIKTNGSSAVALYIRDSAAGGVTLRCGYWNAWNAQKLTLAGYDTTASHTYTTTAFRQWNGATTFRAYLVVGVARDRGTARFLCDVDGNGVSAAINIGFNSTTVGYGNNGTSSTSDQTQVASFASFFPAVGSHYLNPLEYGNASTPIFYGASVSSFEVDWTF